jgi:hypothetical protein
MKKTLAPWFVAIGAPIIVITTALANAYGAFTGKTHLWPFLCAYGVSFLALAIAGVLFYRQGDHEKKPFIVPIRFGCLRDGPRKIGGQWTKPTGHPFTLDEILRGQHLEKQGLIFRNDGDPAYHISVPAAEKIGPSTLRFSGRVNRLDNSQGEALLTAVVERGDSHSIINGLFDEMKDNDVECVSVKIQYRGDSDEAWWATVCEIERNVNAEGGLEIRRFNRERIKRPKSD